MKYRLYSDDGDPTLGFLINDNDDPRIEYGRGFDSLIEHVNEPAVISNVASEQLLKYNKAMKQGENDCRILTLLKITSVLK